MASPSTQRPQEKKSITKQNNHLFFLFPTSEFRCFLSFWALYLFISRYNLPFLKIKIKCLRRWLCLWLEREFGCVNSISLIHNRTTTHRWKPFFNFYILITKSPQPSLSHVPNTPFPSTFFSIYFLLLFIRVVGRIVPWIRYFFLFFFFFFWRPCGL